MCVREWMRQSNGNGDLIVWVYANAFHWHMIKVAFYPTYDVTKKKLNWIEVCRPKYNGFSIDDVNVHLIKHCEHWNEVLRYFWVIIRIIIPFIVLHLSIHFGGLSSSMSLYDHNNCIYVQWVTIQNPCQSCVWSGLYIGSILNIHVCVYS